MPDYTVKQGDCIESIAKHHGLFWETVWNDPKNQQLRSVRKDHNILLAGDKIFVPEIRSKEETCAAEQKHSFKRKGVPSKIRIVLKDEKDQPRANVAYILEIDGELLSGKTDAAGLLDHPISPRARHGKLIICSGQQKDEFMLRLGNLDPVMEISGVQSRLHNLGFDCEVTGTLDDHTREAIREFQTKHSLAETGEPDQATQSTLEQAHGS